MWLCLVQLIDSNVEVKLQKPVVAQCVKTQAVMTLSQFEYDVAEICTLSNAVALVVACRLLYANNFGATANE